MTPPRPAFVLTGPPGSGKSSTGRELALAMRAALLDLDSMTNPLLDVVVDALGGRGYDDPRVAALVRRARYECVLGAAEDCLRSGVPVVLVAPFSEERSEPAAWRSLAGRLSAAGGDPRLIFLKISREELAKRLRRRGARRDAAKLVDLDRYVASVDLRPPSSPHVAVDASSRAQVQVQDCLRAMGLTGGP